MVEEVQKVRQIQVHYIDNVRIKVFAKPDEVVLKDFDPVIVLFEYMKREGLRLIDLFRSLDTDESSTISRTEFKEGFKVSLHERVSNYEACLEIEWFLASLAIENNNSLN